MTHKQPSCIWLRNFAAIAILLLLVTSSACAARHEESVPRCLVAPKIFCEPYQSFWWKLSTEERQNIRASSNFGTVPRRRYIELQIRNTYELWEDTPITRFFRSRGIEHPDIMSDIFLQGFIEYLRGHKVDMDHVTTVVHESLKPPPPPPPPSENWGRSQLNLRQD